MAVPLRWAWLLRSQAQLRSTANGAGRKAHPLDSQSKLPEPSKIKPKQVSHLVTPLMAQRITLTGNSYFWRTARRTVRRGRAFHPQ